MCQLYILSILPSNSAPPCFPTHLSHNWIQLVLPTNRRMAIGHGQPTSNHSPKQRQMTLSPTAINCQLANNAYRFMKYSIIFWYMWQNTWIGPIHASCACSPTTPFLFTNFGILLFLQAPAIFTSQLEGSQIYFLQKASLFIVLYNIYLSFIYDDLTPGEWGKKKLCVKWYRTFFNGLLLWFSP